MRRFISFSFWLIAMSTLTLHAQQRLTLTEALAKKLVEISIEANGGYQGQCIQLLVKNMSNQIVSLEVPPGQIFASDDSAVQDLMVTDEAYLALGPRQTKSKNLFTMCTQGSNMSPGKGEGFSLGDMAEGDLLKLAQKIAEKDYQNSTAQSAVWAVADRGPVSEVYGTDTAMVRDVATTVSEARGIPLSEFSLLPREHQITAIRTSLECLIPHHLSNARLALYDKDGQIVRHYFSGRKVEAGFMQYRVGANHTLGEEAELYLRLSEGDELITERRIFPTDNVTPLKKVHTRTVLTFDVSKTVKADIGVYDEADNLYLIVSEARTLPRGFHRKEVIVSKPLPQDQAYWIKVKANGTTLSEQAMNLEAPAPVRHAKRTISGVFTCKLDKQVRDAKLAVYDSEGRIKRILFNASVLNPGNKRFTYQFEHGDGPRALFYVRLVGKDDSVLAEKVVK